METAVFAFCALTLFAFGWVAARWNWASNWHSSVSAGGSAGLIAGCLIYDFIGAFHYGLLGQKDLLASLSRQMSETEVLTIMIDAFSSSALQVYFYFLIVVAAATIVGALGGLASAMDIEDVWGKPPREPEQWMFRMSAYTLALNGAVWAYIALEAMYVLQDSATKTILNASLTDFNPMALLIIVNIHTVNMAMTVFPLGLTWGWIIRAWKGAGLWRALYVIWLLASCTEMAWIGRWFIQYANSANFVFDSITSYYGVSVISCALIAGIALGLLSTPLAPPTSRYRFTDWLGCVLAQGIFGGTQVFISVPAYALVLVLITMFNVMKLLGYGSMYGTPTQQIANLAEIMNIIAALGIALCLFGAMIFGGVVTGVRRFLQVPKVMEEAPA